MIDSIAIGVAFVLLVVVAFVVSIRLGMLLGLRLDRVLEARATTDGDGPGAEHDGQEE